MNDRMSMAIGMTQMPRGYSPRKFAVHVIRADGSHEPLDAEAIYVDMGTEGRDLLIDLHERRKGEGLPISNMCCEDRPGGSVSITPGAANVIYVNVSP